MTNRSARQTAGTCRLVRLDLGISRSILKNVRKQVCLKRWRVIGSSLALAHACVDEKRFSDHLKLPQAGSWYTLRSRVQQNLLEPITCTQIVLGTSVTPGGSSGGVGTRNCPDICILALQEKRQQRKRSRSLLRFDHVITPV